VVRRQRTEVAARRPRPGDLRRVVQELEVHQVELQIQNQELLETQAALTAARDRFARLFDRAPVAYLVLDGAGVIRHANDTACTLLDRPRHRLSRHALRGFVASSDQPALVRHLQDAAGGAGRARAVRVTLEGPAARIVRLDTVRQEPELSDESEYRMTMVDLTEQPLAEQRLRAERRALERSQSALRELTHKLMVVEERERRRIAADLHDDIGQRLLALQVDLALLRRRPRTAVASQVDALCARLEQIAGDLDRLVRNLHPKIVDDLGLRVALKAYAEDLQRQTNMTVRFRERGVAEVIPAEVAICLYRVAQEALRNVHRHAAADAATVTLARVGRSLGLCVADRGRGFDARRTRQPGRGLGLVTMHERVHAIGGHFRVRANPGDGTHVHAWVPLP
jgi:signal transduction histidine kinase